MADNLLTRLFLDAQDAFLEAVDHVPAPGQGGPIGALNAPGWIVAHIASGMDAWIERHAAGQSMEPWAERTQDEMIAAYREGKPQPAYPLSEARDAFVRVQERTARWVTEASWEHLQGPADLSGTPFANVPTSRVYMVARSVAHLYVHAGELSVIASLMAAGDLGLPGALVRSGAPTAADDASGPVVAALLRDGYVEVERAAQVTPTPAAEGAMDRLNAVAETLIHLAGREDRVCNVAGQALGSSSLLLAATPDPATAGAPPWAPARDAYRDVVSAAHPWLETLTPQAAAQPMEWRGTPSSLGAQIARSAGHQFAHAGEMMAHASLYGVADLGMPGQLAHVAATAPPVEA
ncbi:MAG: hypothetical protein M0R73_10110 [Dehalococcoidia bacterium]|nr:hypothetical protein [Dehalococcoidia bacterium]